MVTNGYILAGAIYTEKEYPHVLQYNATVAQLSNKDCTRTHDASINTKIQLHEGFQNTCMMLNGPVGGGKPGRRRVLKMGFLHAEESWARTGRLRDDRQYADAI